MRAGMKVRIGVAMTLRRDLERGVRPDGAFTGSDHRERRGREGHVHGRSGERRDHLQPDVRHRDARVQHDGHGVRHLPDLGPRRDGDGAGPGRELGAERGRAHVDVQGQGRRHVVRRDSVHRPRRRRHVQLDPRRGGRELHRLPPVHRLDHRTGRHDARLDDDAADGRSAVPAVHLHPARARPRTSTRTRPTSGRGRASRTRSAPVRSSSSNGGVAISGGWRPTPTTGWALRRSTNWCSASSRTTRR